MELPRALERSLNVSHAAALVCDSAHQDGVKSESYSSANVIAAHDASNAFLLCRVRWLETTSAAQLPLMSH